MKTKLLLSLGILTVFVGFLIADGFSGGGTSRGDSNGNVLLSGIAQSLADANSNVQLVPQLGNAGSTAAAINQNFPFLFNGSTWDRQAYCAPTAPTTINPNTGTTTVLLAAVAAKTHHLCMLEISDTGGATGQTVKITDGTQVTNPCDTGAVTLSPTYQFVANATQLNITVGNGSGVYLNGAAVNHQLCVVTTAAVSVFVTAHFTDY